MHTLLPRGRWAAGFLLAFTIVMLLTLPVMAADGATTADFGPLLQLALEIAALILAPVAMLLAHKLIAYLGKIMGVKVSERHTAVIDQAIARGLGYAQHALDVKLSAGMPIDLRNKVIAQAVNYALPKIPDAMAHFGITEDGLAERIAGELMQRIGPDPLAKAPPLSA